MIKLRHVGITVSDAEVSIKFYKKLGFEVFRDMDESGEYIDKFSGLGTDGVDVRTIKMKGTDNSLIELLDYRYPLWHKSTGTETRPINKVGCSHFAVTVDNLDERYTTMLEEGIKFNSEPQLSPDGMAKIAFCRDPDGILIEMVEIVGC